AGGEASTSAGAAWKAGSRTTEGVTARCLRTTRRPCSSTSIQTRTTAVARSLAATSVGTQRARSLSAPTSHRTPPIRRFGANILGIPDATGDREETDIDTGQLNPTTFGEDSCGHMYVAGQGGNPNTVFRIRQQDPPGVFCISQYDLPVLTANVNNDSTIHLLYNGEELNGQALPQGAYTLELDDNSANHNFHLLSETGSSSVSCVPVTSCASDVAGMGHQTWTVNFTTGGGDVTYRCDVHQQTMRGTF